MSSLAASALPLAALVLAWDETTPAVRALLEATQSPDPALASILVMVPRAEAPDMLSAEEYLPLPPLNPRDEADNEPKLTPPAATTLPESHLLPFAPALPKLAPLPTAAVLPSSQHAPQLWAAVRVLRLSSHSLPELAHRAGQPLPAPAWTGTAAAPATPYQGATPPPIATEPLPPTPVSGLAALLPPTYEPAEPLALAPDAEPDWPLALIGEELLRFELGLAEEAELPTLAPLPEPDGWPAALAALRQPVALPTAQGPTPRAAPDATATMPLLHAPYDAPNLNFQVIQYARFAVPVALAEAPYAVIYAPAWPTWLAAQELRQRTGQPLVLHVAALAAPAHDSLETATGWMAELQRQALRRADVILTETAALAQRLCRELGLPGSCVHTVPAADAAAVAQALRAARPRPAAVPT